ncbi:MFS transporter [Ruminococcus sp.]|uniref:MFS transporter n=1 Tax=Ruminococcus sp. TaxID=41978 RepID=UPI00388D1BE8
MSKNYGKTKRACYLGFVTQAISANFAPLLFLTFHQAYGISFSAIAMISVVFYVTQLIVDIVCVRLADRFGYRACMVAAEIVSAVGLAGLAFVPDLLSNHLLGILLCVVVYAIGSGLIEVLCSPIIEACPFENKEKMMSLLHSFYCWGTVGVIAGSTLFFSLFGIQYWRILACIWALIPLYNVMNFAACPIEPIVEDGKGMTIGQLLKTKRFWLFIILMICAGASEITMAQWASAFAESALHVPKTWGDLAGPCGFAVLMGLSRMLYGKFGDKIDLSVFMILSGALCFVSYLLTAFAGIPVMGLIGCMACGFSVGIMWPGSISISARTIPAGGTAMFALLALAGDIGGTLGPAVVGNVSQLSGDNLQAGILGGMGFPLTLVICVAVARRLNPKRQKRQAESYGDIGHKQDNVIQQ